ncbi:uncharacterized protein LOC132167445 isoform X2 [Corylus avellana]|uniref:uncharacterized protein LOC132167445 isoform X2 n=1 Tax=Corylus avellana TaxID=13451 RepID=UPI00286BD399|nr:uncharacterized protein LOC132167445 isoform X2 [Corylus avellana]
MDHIAAAEERIASESVQQKLHQVNLAAKEHLSPIQDHVNFTLQQAYFKCAYECFDRRRSHDDISNCVENCSVPVVRSQQMVENEMAKFQITVYFMELATPHTEEAIKLVDKVEAFEWLIQKYEIDGAAALRLDLSLDTPMIIIPRNSTSKDFIQLDLGQLQLTNEFSWHGSPKKDPSAVDIDVLLAEEHYSRLWGSTCL